MCQGAIINMQEIPGTSERGGVSAKVTAKDHAREFPDALHKSRCKQSYTMCIVVITNESQRLTNTFLMQNTSGEWLKSRDNRQDRSP